MPIHLFVDIIYQINAKGRLIGILNETVDKRLELNNE